MPASSSFAGLLLVYLQATASAADLSETRCHDDLMMRDPRMLNQLEELGGSPTTTSARMLNQLEGLAVGPATTSARVLNGLKGLGGGPTTTSARMLNGLKRLGGGPTTTSARGWRLAELLGSDDWMVR